MKARTLLTTVVLLAAVGALASPTASAATHVFELTGDQEGSQTFFFADANGTRNPTLNVSVGDEVEIRVTMASGFHNLHVAKPVDAKTDYGKTGETVTLRFTVPEDAPMEIPYYCDPHRANGMEGVIAVAGGRPVETNSTPGVGAFGAALAALGAAGALAAARRFGR